MPPQHQPIFAVARPRVPKRGRAHDDNARRRQRTLPPVFPPLPPLEGLSETDLETPGDGLAALMLLRQSWQLDTAGVWPPSCSGASCRFCRFCLCRFCRFSLCCFCCSSSFLSSFSSLFLSSSLARDAGALLGHGQVGSGQGDRRAAVREERHFFLNLRSFFLRNRTGKKLTLSTREQKKKPPRRRPGPQAPVLAL